MCFLQFPPRAYRNIKLEYELETNPKKLGQDQKLIIDKKSTVFMLSSLNLFKMTYKRGGPFGQVS